MNDNLIFLNNSMISNLIDIEDVSAMASQISTKWASFIFACCVDAPAKASFMERVINKDLKLPNLENKAYLKALNEHDTVLLLHGFLFETVLDFTLKADNPSLYLKLLDSRTTIGAVEQSFLGAVEGYENGQGTGPQKNVLTEINNLIKTRYNNTKAAKSVGQKITSLFDQILLSDDDLFNIVKMTLDQSVRLTASLTKQSEEVLSRKLEQIASDQARKKPKMTY